LTRRSKRINSAFTIACLATSFLFTAAGLAAEPPTQATMQEMFRALATAYELSLAESTYQDPENRQRIQSALEQLSNNANALDEHGQGWESSSRWVRRSLAEDSRAALQRYEAGQYRASRFNLHLLTESCFACHSKLPQGRRSVVGKSFMENISKRGLAPEQKAQIAVVTRQFDRALEIYESMFKSLSLKPEKAALRGAFEDYLKVALRVYGNYDRPLRTFRALAQRDDVPGFLVSQLQDWIASLESLRTQNFKGNELALARALIRKAKVEQSYPGSREGLVDLVAASGALQRYLASSEPEPARAAEAYYLLGVAEAYISRSHWISETEFFLETSIRTDPTSPVAPKAFAFLDEYIRLGYSGSSGTHIPPDVRAKLNELQKLITQKPDKGGR